MVYSISIFRRVICGLEPLRKTLPFLLLTDALAFSSHWGFRTSQQCQGIPRIAVVNFKALDFISLVWNLIWFQNSSKKVHRVLPTSENFTPDRGHHEACVAEGLRGSCQGIAVAPCPCPGLRTISVCLLLSYGMWNFQMQDTCNCIITILLTFNIFFSNKVSYGMLTSRFSALPAI